MSTKQILSEGFAFFFVQLNCIWVWIRVSAVRIGSLYCEIGKSLIAPV